MKRLSFTLTLAFCVLILSPALPLPACDDPGLAPLEKAVSLEPSNVVNRYNLAAAYYNKQCWGEALEAFKKTAETNRADKDSHAKLDAQCWQAAGLISLQDKVHPDPAQAAVYFRKSYDLAPGEWETVYGLGLALKKTGKTAEAVTYLKKACALKPDADAQYQLSEALLTVVESDPRALPETLASLNKTVELAGSNRPMQLVCLKQLARLSLAQKDHAEAIRAFRRMVALDPQDYDANYGLGLEYYQNKDYDKMVESYERATRAAPEKVDAHFNLGVAYDMQQRYDEAVDEFRTVTRLQPSNSEALAYLSQLMGKAVENGIKNGSAAMTEEKYGQALSAFNKVLELDPSNATALKGAQAAGSEQSRAFDKFKRDAAGAGSREQKLSLLAEAQALKPDDAGVRAQIEAIGGQVADQVALHMRRGKKYEDAGDFVAAAQEFSRTLALKKGYAPAAQALARINSHAGAALALAEKAYKAGNLRGAKKQFEKARRWDPENKAAAGGLARVNTQIAEKIKALNAAAKKAFAGGDKAGSRELFDQALAFDPANAEANDYVRRMTGKESKAKASAEEVKKLYLKGVDFYVTGKIPEAIESWKQVMKLDPEHEDARKNKERAEAKLAAIKKLTSS